MHFCLTPNIYIFFFLNNCCSVCWKQHMERLRFFIFPKTHLFPQSQKPTGCRYLYQYLRIVLYLILHFLVRIFKKDYYNKLQGNLSLCTPDWHPCNSWYFPQMKNLRFKIYQNNCSNVSVNSLIFNMVKTISFGQKWPPK